MATKPFRVRHSLKVGNTDTNANVALEIGSTDGILLPSGNVAQRPTAANGIFRYNSEDKRAEIYANGAWNSLAFSGIETFNVVSTANTFYVGNSTQNTTINSTHITANGGTFVNTLMVPVGNTTQRSATVNGNFYYNDETKRFQGVANGAWFNIPDEARLILIDEAQNLTAAQKKQVLQNAGVIQVTTIGDANATIANTALVLYPNAALTTTRTWTLPAAASVPAGWTIDVIDIEGRVGSSNNINIVRAGADTLNGGTTTTLRRPYDRVKLFSDGVSRWFTISDEALLSKILQVDGTGSGIDADVLRGTTPGTAGLAVLDDATTNAIHTTLGVYPSAVYTVGGSAQPLVASPTSPFNSFVITASSTKALSTSDGTLFNGSGSWAIGGLQIGLQGLSFSGYIYTGCESSGYQGISTAIVNSGLTVGGTYLMETWGYCSNTSGQMYVWRSCTVFI